MKLTYITITKDCIFKKNSLEQHLHVNDKLHFHYEVRHTAVSEVLLGW